MNHARVAIIGAGPAGYTAAIYASRAMLEPVMFEGLQPGGQLMLTTDVENWPGYPEGILGPDLMQQIRKQAERFGTKMFAQMVDSVDLSQRPFKFTSNGESWTADALIIATGASAKWLGIPGETEYQGKGVSACATCDGFFFRGKKVLVVGGGDSAMEEANFLTKFATEVVVVVRGETLRASKIMQERAQANEKISFVYNAESQEVLGDGTKLTGLKIKDQKTGEERVLEADGLFVAIGHKPNTDLFKGQLALNPVGYIQLEPGTQFTSVKGVFAAGDVADFKYRQGITAAGTGCAAALEAERYLAEHE